MGQNKNDFKSHKIAFELLYWNKINHSHSQLMKNWNTKLLNRDKIFYKT